MGQEMTIFTQHPLSAAFPSMPEGEIEALAMDIEKHGQREPGVTLDGMVLDGWHRYLACKKAGRDFVCADFDGADPVAFVISHNLHRRHLTASQRAAAVVSTTNWRPNGVKDSCRAAAAHLSNKQLAEKAEVSERTIKDAKTAERAGLGDAVREGLVSADRAAEIAKLPKARREKALSEPSKPRVVIAERKFEKLYEEVKAELIAEREAKSDLADTARDLADKLTAFEATEPDEQQKEIMKLQKRIVRLEAEVERVTIARNDCQNKNNELIRQVKMLQRKSGGK